MAPESAYVDGPQAQREPTLEERVEKLEALFAELDQRSSNRLNRLEAFMRRIFHGFDTRKGEEDRDPFPRTG